MILSIVATLVVVETIIDNIDIVFTIVNLVVPYFAECRLQWKLLFTVPQILL